MPRIDHEEHVTRDWRVHDLVRDFELLDVWEYPVRARPPHDLAYFADFTRRAERDLITGAGPVARLFRLRAVMGRVLGWDDDREPLPIPGCAETTLRARLEPGEAAESGTESLSPVEGMGFEMVYQFDNELLHEISNATVHAAMHISWVDKRDGTHAPRMAVYVKTRGWLGRAYMALISPFRRYLVYPGLMRMMKSSWSAAHPDSRT